MELEKLAKQIMKECEKDGEPVSFEEALEMAEMEIKAKGIKRYEHSESKTEKKKERPPRKVDSVKLKLLTACATGIENLGYKVSMHNEADFDFVCDGVEYTVKLVKHRPPKK